MIAEQFEIDNGRNSQIDRIYLLPTVPRRILRRAMSMQKPLERKVAWSLIRICRSSGHRNRWRLHFQSRLFDCNSVSRSSTTEQLRGSLISFFYLSSCTVTFATCISLRKHAFSRTLFGSANTEPVDWTFYLFFFFFFPFFSFFVCSCVLCLVSICFRVQHPRSARNENQATILLAIFSNWCGNINTGWIYNAH